MKLPLLLYGTTEPEHPHFSPDMLWRTGFRAPDPFWMIEKMGEIWILVSRLEYGRAKREARADKVFLHEGPIGAFLKTHGIASVRIPGSFPHGIARQLKPKVRLEVVEDEIFPARAKKTAWEIREIEKAARAVGEAIGKVRVLLARARIKGRKVYRGEKAVSSELLREVIEQSLFGAGYLASGTIASSGKDAAYPHAAGKGPITAHMPIVLDIFPRSKTTNYYADITRTLFKGAPSEPLRRMYRAVLDAQKRAIAGVRAGADAADLYRGVMKDFESGGYPTSAAGKEPHGMIHGLGHSVGIEIHEAPRVGSVSRILEAGNVITIEPGLYYPNGLPSSLRRGGRGWGVGIRIEDMVVVEKRGGRVIGKIPKGFEWAIIP